jgi:hypothetical protein
VAWDWHIFPRTGKRSRSLRRKAWLRVEVYGTQRAQRFASPSCPDLATLEHDPEKACPGLDPGWVPVFGKDHAPTITKSGTIRRIALPL